MLLNPPRSATMRLPNRSRCSKCRFKSKYAGYRCELTSPTVEPWSVATVKGNPFRASTSDAIDQPCSGEGKYPHASRRLGASHGIRPTLFATHSGSSTDRLITELESARERV